MTTDVTFEDALDTGDYETALNLAIADFEERRGRGQTPDELERTERAVDAAIARREKKGTAAPAPGEDAGRSRPGDFDPLEILRGLQAEITRGRPHPGQQYRHGWIPVGPTLETAEKWHASLEGLAPLIRAVHSGEAGRERLGGGQMGETYKVQHHNGKTTVAKRLLDVSDTMGPDLGDPERQADAEQLSAALGKKIGAPVPAVLRLGLAKVQIEYKPGSAPTDADTEVAKSTRAGKRLGLFDILTGAWDRPDNWSVDSKGDPVAFDHSFAFWDGADPADPPPGGAVGPFAEAFVRFDIGNGYHADWGPNPLTAADVDWLRQRLADVKPEFEEAGRSEMWEFAAARLEAVAPYASGTEGLFT